MNLEELTSTIIHCEKCERLVAYRQRIAHEKRKAFREWTYWGKPIAGFGDPLAQVLIVGLAPAAHGGNRTGRAFTGDSSGDFLFAALHRAGYANQPMSISRDDGLKLQNAYIVAACRCAPPDNKPTRHEFEQCFGYLQTELGLLPQVRVLLALGQLAFDACLRLLNKTSEPERSKYAIAPKPIFGHNKAYKLGKYWLMASYHPSHRNTATKLLTPAMFDEMLFRVRHLSET
jgi:uracil-DNA glycosylase family 4